MFDSTPSTTLRSNISQNVEKQDIGKIFALIACTESITAIISSLFFTKLYSISLNKDAWFIGHAGNGFVYFLGACLLLLALPLIEYARRIDRKTEQERSSITEQTNGEEDSNES
ncbi:unnamed protein product [Gordionus sp. m RMFG-2023]